jgi:urease accessory protein
MIEKKLIDARSLKSILLLTVLVGGCLWLVAAPATAHHMMGGKIPANFFDGFMSGLGHPVIGLDHLTFAIAVGLLASRLQKGVWLPIAFLSTALVGTSLHLMQVSLPIVEFCVSGSVLIFGALLAMKRSLSFAVILGLGAIAGFFHGYAYGESIFGAETTPLFAYLLGFTTIQLAISLIAWFIGKRLLVSTEDANGLPLRFAGFTIIGVGATFLGSLIVSSLLPLPPS